MQVLIVLAATAVLAVSAAPPPRPEVPAPFGQLRPPFFNPFNASAINSTLSAIFSRPPLVFRPPTNSSQNATEANTNATDARLFGFGQGQGRPEFFGQFNASSFNATIQAILAQLHQQFGAQRPNATATEPAPAPANSTGANRILRPGFFGQRPQCNSSANATATGGRPRPELFGLPHFNASSINATIQAILAQLHQQFGAQRPNATQPAAGNSTASARLAAPQFQFQLPQLPAFPAPPQFNLTQFGQGRPPFLPIFNSTFFGQGRPPLPPLFNATAPAPPSPANSSSVAA